MQLGVCSLGYLLAGTEMKFRFIDKHKQDYGVQRICAVLNISRSGYYAWRKRPVSQRKIPRTVVCDVLRDGTHVANETLLKQIRVVYEQSRKTYGSPRIHRVLQSQGICCGRNRVARLTPHLMCSPHL